jgi:hypothetical protein
MDCNLISVFLGLALIGCLIVIATLALNLRDARHYQESAQSEAWDWEKKYKALSASWGKGYGG